MTAATTPPHPFASPGHGEVTRLMRWLTSYVDQPHPQLGRDGAVCPFTAAMVRARALTTWSYTWPHGAGQRTVTAVVRRAVECFLTVPWPREAPANLHALVLLLPDLPREAWPLLDDAHAAVKPQAVAGGLMLGQFHPDCAQPAVHNPAFRHVSRSPMPLLAVRRMPVHDLLFLHDHPQHFAAYRRRFGHLYGAGQAPAALSELYGIAHARHRMPSTGAGSDSSTASTPEARTPG